MSSTISSVRSSPIPDLAYDSYRSLSLRDQTLVKRQLQQNSPVEPGNSHNHQNINPQQLPAGGGAGNSQQSTFNRSLNRNGSRNGTAVMKTDTMASRNHFYPDPFSPNYVVADGKAHSLSKYFGESMAFWVLLAILAVLAIINALLTFVIFGVLRLGAGLESLEILPKVLKFYGIADLDEIFKRDGLLEALPNIPMEFTGDNGDVNFFTPSGSQPSLSVNQNIINISQVSVFQVTDRRGNQVFSTNTPTLGLPKGLKSLDVRLVKANRITSAVNSTLQLRSHTLAWLKGSEGTNIKGKQIVLAADQDVFLKSVNGNIVISGRDGLFLDVNALPLVRDDKVTRNSYTYTTQGKRESQYQLCICMPEGKLFKVQIPNDNHLLPERKRIGCHTPKNACRM